MRLAHTLAKKWNRFVCLVACVSGVLLVALSAPGDTIPSITLGMGGPDQTLPLGSPFYIQGDASDASLVAVGAAFIEYSHNVWNIEGATDCSKISTILSKLQVADDPQNPGTPLLFRASATTTTLSHVWTVKPAAPAAGVAAPASPPRGLQDILKDRVFLPAAWTRAAASDKQYRFLVGGSFFQSGARYCMFSYLRKKASTDETGAIAKIATEYTAAVRACGQCPTPPATVGAKQTPCPTGASAPDSTALGICRQGAADQAYGGIMRLLTPPGATVSADAANALRTSALNMLAAGLDLANSTHDVLALSELFAGASAGAATKPFIQTSISVPGDSSTQDLSPVVADADPSPPGANQAPSDSLLATIVARLLVREGVLDLVAPSSAAGKPRFWFEKGALDIHSLGIQDDYSGFRVAEDPTKSTKRATIPVDLSKVILPGSKLSLKDLVMLATHKIAYATSGYIPLSDLPKKINESLAKSTPSKDGTATQDPSLGSFGDALGEWDRLVTSSKNAADPLHAALYEWLTQDVLLDCRHVTTPSNQTMSTDKDTYGLVYCLAAAGGPPTPQESLGFTTSTGEPLSPFGALAARISDDARDIGRVSKLASTEVQPTFAQSYATNPLDVSLQMTQKSFLTTFVTPMVGYAAYLTTHDSFWEPELGIDVYFFPNPVDEPMWINGGDDWRRLFAVELAVSPVSGNFGPGGRYTTLNGVPPLFVGGAFQLIPYVTLSTGCALVGTRPPEIPQASTSVVASFYMGLSVQANVPDTIRALANNGNNTTMSGGASK